MTVDVLLIQSVAMHYTIKLLGCYALSNNFLLACKKKTPAGREKDIVIIIHPVYRNSTRRSMFQFKHTMNVTQQMYVHCISRYKI